MNPRVLAATFSVLLASTASAQPWQAPNEALSLTREESGDPLTPWRYTVDFWSKAGRTYVVEETDDLANLSWRRLPGLVLGGERYRWALDENGYRSANIPEAYRSFESNTERQFVRLRHVDYLIEPFAGDYDRDGVSNHDEATVAMTDPFAYPDEDLADNEPDGLPDAWERYRFGGLQLGPQDRDPAGHTLAERYAVERRDSDGDGLPDAWEKFRCGGTLAENGATLRDGKPNLARFREDRVKLADHRFGAQEFRYDPAYIGNAFGPTPEDPLKVHLVGNQGGSMIVAYSDITYSEITSVRVWPSNRAYGVIDPQDPDLATHYADYTGAVVNGAYEYTFVATPATGDYVARDLLKTLHGRPLKRRQEGGATRLSFAPLAITSLPLTEARPDRYPAVLRDFPYASGQYATFPEFGWDLTPSKNTIHAELAGGPLYGLPVPDPSTLNENSGYSLVPWFTYPDAFAFSIEKKEAEEWEYPELWHGIRKETHFFPHQNDVGSLWGEPKNRQCFTLELHFRLDYDLADTALDISSDDACWIFIDGRKVVDRSAGWAEWHSLSSLRQMVKNRDGQQTPFLETATGSCIVDLFFAERFYEDSYLTFLANAPVKPIYVYQVVVDCDWRTPLTYSLTQHPPGMQIDPHSGKIFWDYYGLNADADPANDVAAGAHPVTVHVSDARGHSDTQSFTLNLSL